MISFAQRRMAGPAVFFALLLFVALQPLHAQTTDDIDAGLQSLRSDVGIIGLTANIQSLNSFEYFKDDTLMFDESTELEFKLRNVRMMSPRVGIGFQLLTSFFVNDAEGEPSFGIGSWGIGPILRAYPFKTDRLQPYLQGEALFGNNMAVGDLADAKEAAGGFRVRLSLRGGIAYRFTNRFGMFVEAGPDWESGRIFKRDARTLQINIGFDLYRFN